MDASLSWAARAYGRGMDSQSYHVRTLGGGHTDGGVRRARRRFIPRGDGEARRGVEGVLWRTPVY